MTRILIAEDSTTIQRVLTTLLKDEKGIEIAGIAGNGKEAVDMCLSLRPDLVTMDIFMPEMNGLEATVEIMKKCPTPIVIISSMIKSKDTRFAFEAMRSGAVEVIQKPTGILAGRYQEIKESIIRVIRESVQANPDAQLSWLPGDFTETEGLLSADKPRIAEPLDLSRFKPEIVCIGGSTGAPTVIVEILSRLPSDYPVPIVAAQHITRGFAPRMAEWMNASTRLKVKLVEKPLRTSPGVALMCPDDQHVRFGPDGRLILFEPEEKNTHIPCIDMLFSSASVTFREKAVGIILSGMGRDGAEGLLNMKEAGALTIGQNEQTSVVFGMNRVASEKMALNLTLQPNEIADTLIRIGKNF